MVGKKPRRKGPPKKKVSVKGERDEKTIVQAVEAYEYRLQGHTFRTIAEAMGLSLSYVADLVKIGREIMVREPADELIQMQIDRCNSLVSAFMANAAKGDVQSASVVMKAMDQIDAYHGIGRSTPNETKTKFKTPDGGVVEVRSITRRIVPAAEAT